MGIFTPRPARRDSAGLCLPRGPQLLELHHRRGASHYRGLLRRVRSARTNAGAHSLRELPDARSLRITRSDPVPAERVDFLDH
jgi:hypothetical protein